MRKIDIANEIDLILRKSRISLIFTIVVIAMIACSTYYYITTIDKLSSEVSELQRHIDKKTFELASIEGKFKSVQQQMLTSLNALNFLQEGSRYLLNRQYPEAIERFETFLEVHPNSSEALNFLGYAELKYVQFWRENKTKKSITSEQKAKYEESERKYFALAKKHLERARSKSSYPWPAYNLALLLLQNGQTQQALSELESLLKHHAFMTRWLCDDGQFRKMRTNVDTADKFKSIVLTAALKEGRSSCWVIKKPVS